MVFGIAQLGPALREGGARPKAIHGSGIVVGQRRIPPELIRARSLHVDREPIIGGRAGGSGLRHRL